MESFTLQKLNVIRIVEDEYQKAKLIAEGFIEVKEKEKVEVIEEKEVKKSTSK